MKKDEIEDWRIEESWKTSEGKKNQVTWKPKTETLKTLLNYEIVKQLFNCNYITTLKFIIKYSIARIFWKFLRESFLKNSRARVFRKILLQGFFKNLQTYFKSL